MREIGDLELLRELYGFFGVQRAVGVLGWLVMVGIVAPADADRRWILAEGPSSRATRYRRVGECEAFMSYLASKGLGVELVDRPSWVLRRVVGL